MKKELTKEQIMFAGKNFNFEGELISMSPYGNGHINDTFLAITTKQKYIVQRMNTYVFNNPLDLLSNIEGVTSFIRNKVIENNGDPNREVLTLIKTKSGLNYFVDSNNNYRRAYLFIDNATSYDQVQNPKDFYESGFSFGNFQKMLSSFPVKSLNETIKDFHNTAKRYQKFLIAVDEDKNDRKKEVLEEIKFIKKHSYLCDALNGLPLRVTHNDTKLNNIMIDDKTHKGICVIDLDTVMPGYAVTDFGDSIRFGASTALEDEKDLTKVSLDLNLFEEYTKGFILGADGGLTKKEILALPLGAMVMTYECGMRFLTDYLEGDVYFKIHYENHNLVRARTQFKLLSDMLNKKEKMDEIVKNQLN